MSFEGIFEKWVNSKGQAEGSQQDETQGLEQRQQATPPTGDIQRVEDPALASQDALGSNLMIHVPLRNAVSVSSLPSKESGMHNNNASPLHCAPVSRNVKDEQMNVITPPCHGDKIKGCLDYNEIKKQGVSTAVGDKYLKENLSVERQDHCQCHAHSSLVSLKNRSPEFSPAGARVLGADPLLSPENDMHMEPDSTSECVAASASKSVSTRQHSDMRLKVLQGRLDSPCSSGREVNNCGVKVSGVGVHVEESPAECDSTCMYLASPNAISPASQGEIEERACPFLTDHEDGASPAHCVCQCRSLLPPAKLLTAGDNVPTVTTATSASPPSFHSPHFTVRIVSGGSAQLISKPGVIRTQSHESRTSADLEQFANKLELRRKRTEENDQIESVGVTNTVQGRPDGKQLLSQCSVTDSAVSADLSEVKDFPVIKGLLEHSRDETATTRHERSSSSGKQESSGSGKQDARVKCDRKQTQVCDFAKNIDWDTAVAETFESSTSVRGYDGESKPGIILKIRAKAVVPCLEKHLEPKSVKIVASGKRKTESQGNPDPEVLSRLRKRHKSEEQPPSSESANSGQCKARSRLLTSSRESGGCQTSSVSKQTRRNTVHLGEGLTAHTSHLSPSESKFIEACTRLSRLQTLTYNVVHTLFPRLRHHLDHIAAESQTFTEVVDDIINSLECSDTEETARDFEHLSDKLEKLEVQASEKVPVYSPQVVLCNDPMHSLEDFQLKVCNLLQLLLPSLTVSLSDCYLRFPGQLEDVLRRVLSSNKIKGGRKSRQMSC